MLFQKYAGANIGVTNFMSHFSMFVLTKANVELANGNTVPAQGIGIILCPFQKLPHYISYGNILLLSNSSF